MIKENVSKLPQDLQNELVEKIVAINPREIWLFGSYAKGSPSISSDIDIFIVEPKNDPDFHQKLINLRNELKDFQQKHSLEHIDIDIFSDTRKNIKKKIANADEFYNSVFDGAIKLYCKKEKKPFITTNSLSLYERIKRKIFLKMRHD
ncbi:MAG: nucleotidyltransferase domain-containing protein [Campylobacter sp.]|nr:nucleotidyltransferase domain-containing protein [Campylobacter sp.]